jgi:hypothetical protein
MQDNPNRQPARMQQGNYQADVLRHTSDTEQFWYYLIQRRGSNEILDLVKAANYEEAVEAARQALARMQRAIAAGD